jgi:hypothetical protein
MKGERAMTIGAVLIAMVAGAVVSGQTTPASDTPACGAPADSAQPVCGGPGGPPAGECIVTADGPVEVPFRVLNNHVLIPVSVNGSAPLELILDTGMPVYGVMLHPGPEVDAIAFDTEGAPMVMVAGAGGDPCRAALNVTLGLPGVEFTGQLAIFSPPPGGGCNSESPEGASGVIGLSVFDNFVVTFDHDRSVLVLTQPDDFTYAGRGARLPFRLGRPPVPEIDCAIEADGRTVPLTLTVDTGASHNLSITLAPDSDIAPPGGARELVVGYSMWGELTGLIGRGGTLRLGGLALNDILVTYLRKGAPGVPPCGKSGLLGNGALRRFNVTFDYSRKELILEPNSHTTDPFEFNMSGMASRRNADGTYAVSRVFPETPAAEADVVAGDIIVAVDGRPARDIGTEELRRLLERDGAAVTLRLGRGPENTDVVLRLRRLV